MLGRKRGQKTLLWSAANLCITPLSMLFGLSSVVWTQAARDSPLV